MPIKHSLGPTCMHVNVTTGLDVRKHAIKESGEKILEIACVHLALPKLVKLLVVKLFGPRRRNKMQRTFLNLPVVDSTLIARAPSVLALPTESLHYNRRPVNAREMIYRKTS